MAQDGSTVVGSKAALAAFNPGEGAGIKKFTLFSNKPGRTTVDISTGLVSFTYYESILQDVVRATVSFMDTGDSVNGKSVMEGLPVSGEEKCLIEIEDNNKKSIKLEMFVNKSDDLLDDTRKKITILNFASKEFFLNEKVRVNTRFDGLISESVQCVLTEAGAARPKGGQGGNKSRYSGGVKGGKTYLNTDKELFIEETSNKRNFIGNNWKPFHTINWLATQAVPSGQENTEVKAGGTTNSAGFMFWETAKGFHFKSIDGLMNTQTNPPKKRFIYNETAEGPCSGNMPDGYDAKVLEWNIDHRVDVQKKLKMGAYSTRTWLFNPYDSSIEILYPNAFVTGVQNAEGSAPGNQEYLELAGKELPFLNPEFNKNVDFSRTQFRVLDVGTLPEGKGSGEEGENQQLGEASKKENSQPNETLNQSTMRMNQLFACKVIITIPGDFSLHAGDPVYFDAPGKRAESNIMDGVDKWISGNYMISSICHFLDGSNTLTKMDLVRDSFGRKVSERSGVTGSRTSSWPDPSITEELGMISDSSLMNNVTFKPLDDTSTSNGGWNMDDVDTELSRARVGDYSGINDALDIF